MIPKEFKNTYKLQEELRSLKEEEEKTIFKAENSEIAHYVDDEYLEHQKENHESNPQEQFKKKIANNFTKEYEELNKSKIYFLGCSLNNYKHNYNNRLKEFKKKYIDAIEHNFIYDELKLLINYSLPYYINEDTTKSIYYSIERIKEFLIVKLEKLKFDVSFSIDTNGLQNLSIKNKQKDISIQKESNPLMKWTNKPTHLVELGMALIETNSVNVGKNKNQLSENQFYNLLASFFNIKKLYHEKYKGDIRNRIKDQTILLPQLDNALQKAINDRLK